MVRVRNLNKKYSKGNFSIHKVTGRREINVYTCIEQTAYKPETKKRLLVISLWWYELRFILKGRLHDNVTISILKYKLMQRNKTQSRKAYE